MRSQLVESTKQTYGGTNPCTSITVHETGNTGKGATAAAHANLQSGGNSRDASWHITVDDTEAVRSYPDTAQCWHAGNTDGNHTSIAVEICVNSDGDYADALANAAEVVRELRATHDIPRSRVYQHNHWSGKDCPTRLRASGDWTSWVKTTDSKKEGTTKMPRTPAQAVAWSKTVKRGYKGLCLNFVRDCYGIPKKYGSAAIAWSKAKRKHATKSTAGIPVGAPVFFSIPPIPRLGFKGNSYGHVAIYLGGGLFRTNWSAHGTVVSHSAGSGPFYGMVMLGWAEDINGVTIPGLSTKKKAKKKGTAAKPAAKAYPELAIDGHKGKLTIQCWQKLLARHGYYKRVADGAWGHYTALGIQQLLRAQGYYTKAYLLDGKWGTASVKALQTMLKAKGHLDKKKWLTDGKEGTETVKAEQRYLNAMR